MSVPNNGSVHGSYVEALERLCGRLVAFSLRFPCECADDADGYEVRFCDLCEMYNEWERVMNNA